MKWSPPLPQHPSVTTHNHYNNSDTFLIKPRANVSGQALCHMWACVCLLALRQGYKTTHRSVICSEVSRKRGAGRREGRTLESLRLTGEISIKVEEKGTKWKVPWLAHDVPERGRAWESRQATSWGHSLEVCNIYISSYYFLIENIPQRNWSTCFPHRNANNLLSARVTHFQS